MQPLASSIAYRVTSSQIRISVEKAGPGVREPVQRLYLSK